MKLPYLTAHYPGIGGQLKVEPEDFQVEEIPLYLPCGEGQHIYVDIEKRGISTFAAIKQIARALGIPPVAIGYAGLKDAHAVTRQTISIDNVAENAITALDLPHLKVLGVTRHRNKLKTGHLAGNRFIIKVRQVEKEALPVAQAVIAELQQRGVPNYFGEQRFGNRENTHRLGETLIRRQTGEFIGEYLGKPQSTENQAVQAARALVDAGAWAEALAQWPPFLPDERRVLNALVKAGGQPEVIYTSLDKKLKGLFVSAYQSFLFNRLLVERLPNIDRLMAGDVAYIHGKGACFLVEDAGIEQPRADQFEISPAGPLFGPKTLATAGEPGRWEQAVLTEQGLTADDFQVPGLKIRGARRPYRLLLQEARVWWADGLMVSFRLEPGAYATTVMAELMKPE